MTFFTKKSLHIIMNYDIPYMKMGGHYTILYPSKMSCLGATGVEVLCFMLFYNL